jgi:hypothetical protein
MSGFSFKEGPGIFYGINVICWVIIRDFFIKKDKSTNEMEEND